MFLPSMVQFESTDFKSFPPAALAITRHLKLKCLTLKIKNFKFAFNLRKNF